MVTSSHRVCSYCMNSRPISEFRHYNREKNQRSRECRLCHNRRERLRRAAQKKKGLEKQVTAFTNRIRRAASDRQVNALCQQMIVQFGGVDGFVKQWFSVWETDRAKGRAKCFAHIAAVVRLIEYVDDHRTDYGRLTDDEIERRIEEIISSA